MGWTSLNLTEKPKEFFKKEFFTDNERVKHEVLDYATVGSVAYLAMKLTPKVEGLAAADFYEPAPDGTYTYGMVVLTSRKRNGFYNFSYKEMDESMGPVESKCPPRILKQLSPLKVKPGDGPTNWAANWRKRCVENAAKHRPGNYSFESD